MKCTLNLFALIAMMFSFSSFGLDFIFDHSVCVSPVALSCLAPGVTIHQSCPFLVASLTDPHGFNSWSSHIVLSFFYAFHLHVLMFLIFRLHVLCYFSSVFIYASYLFSYSAFCFCSFSVLGTFCITVICHFNGAHFLFLY